ncbi:MAG: protein kinase domain-containing protein [Streptosporangiaceae bacterium]
MSREAGRPGASMSGKIAGYRLDGYIGQSGMAAVYLARDERLDRQVALKVLTPEMAGEAAFRTRLLRESRAAAAVGHPHIIPVYEADDAGGIVYVAMRYVEGGDTGSLLSRLGPLPFAPAWNIISQVASALDAAHARGLIHRDVKPANMLVEPGVSVDSTKRPAGGSVGHMYLSDFGMDAGTSLSEAMATGQFTGTFDYAAPEQIEGRALDGRTDLYSLACAGFELLCGTPLFGPDRGLTVMYAQLYAPPPSAKARRHDLPAAADRVLARALAKNPADRYATCGQFAEELFEALGLAGQAATAPRSRPPGGAGPGPGSGTDSGEQSSPGQRESGPEPMPIPAPAPSEPRAPQPWPEEPPTGPAPQSWPEEPPTGPAPQSWPEEPPTGPDPLSPGSMNRAVGPEPRRSSRRRGVITVILAAAAAVAAVAIGVTVSNRSAPNPRPASRPAATSVPSPAASPAPSPAPSASALASGQAAAVDNLLDSSAATRKALHGAVDEVLDCTNLPGAASQIQNAVSQRGTEYDQASALSASALPDGAAVKSDLIAALRTSLDADKNYLTWAQQQLNLGCTAPAQSSAYSAAASADQRADAAKEAFVQVWNPVAAKYGVQQQSPASI